MNREGVRKLLVTWNMEKPNLWDYLKGKKSYILANILGITTVFYAFDYLNEKQYLAIAGLIASLFGITLRSAIANLNQGE